MSEIRILREGPLLRLTLARPPLNILTIAMLEGLADELVAAVSDPELRLVRIDAEGKAFSAGVDVADHEGDRVEGMMSALERLFLAFEAVPCPIVSVVQGAALGGGCELILGGDLCYASETARFGQPEIRLGLFAPPASVLLPAWVGERRALELLLTGRTLSAQEAQAYGLVHECFPEAEFAEQVDLRVGALLALSGAALRQAKQAVRSTRGLAAGDAHRQVNRQYLDELMQTRDAGEGMLAFAEKRAPRWEHR